MQLSRWDDLRALYSDEDVVLLHIYSRERHPGEKGFPDYHHTRTDEEKMAYARLWADRTHLPVAVDTIDQQVLKLYGEVPNGAFVIDRQGTLVFRSTWADHNKVQQIIDQLLAHEAANETAS